MRRRHATSPHSRDRWLLSYADFMTLLFAFFTTLYAATTVDATKRSAVAESVRAAVGSALSPDETPRPETPHSAVAPAQPAGDGNQIARARFEIERELGDALGAGQLELVEDKRGLVLAIPEAGAFETGRAEVSDTAARVMRRLARALALLPNAIRVEGHTDDTPIRATSRFRSNWELSTARATRVVEFFMTEGQIAPARLSAAGYSEFHPRVAADTPAARASNRRVDIVILNLGTSQLEEPGGAGVK